MTPQEAARFVLGDGRDPVLRAKADAEAEAMLAEAMRDPGFRARFDENLQVFADTIDARILVEMRDSLNRMLNDRELHARVEKQYREGITGSIADLPDWYQIPDPNDIMK